MIAIYDHGNALKSLSARKQGQTLSSAKVFLLEVLRHNQSNDDQEYYLSDSVTSYSHSNRLKGGKLREIRRG